mmetsp:Transcript_45690/g.97950  ORF Transcript_45690/g.97950 Transcript_45690/m.97950 type:complete len:251 (-) Transcript_45690:349-1101(-)
MAICSAGAVLPSANWTPVAAGLSRVVLIGTGRAWLASGQGTRVPVGTRIACEAIADITGAGTRSPCASRALQRRPRKCWAIVTFWARVGHEVGRAIVPWSAEIAILEISHVWARNHWIVFYIAFQCCLTKAICTLGAHGAVFLIASFALTPPQNITILVFAAAMLATGHIAQLPDEAGSHTKFQRGVDSKAQYKSLMGVVPGGVGHDDPTSKRRSDCVQSGDVAHCELVTFSSIFRSNYTLPLCIVNASP